MSLLENPLETTSNKPAPVPDSPGGNALRRGAVRGGAVLMGSRLLVQVFSWSVTLLVARFLRPYDYGVMTAGSILLLLGDTLTEAGLGTALVRKQDLKAEDTDQAFTLSLMASVALYALLFAASVPAARLLRTQDLVGFLRVCGLSFLIVPFRTVPMALLERRLHLGRQSATHAIGMVVQGCLVLGLAATGFGYWALAAGFIAGQALWAASLMLLARWTPRLCWPGTAAYGLLSFGLHVSGASLLWFLYSQSDFAVVSWLAGPVELGYYALAFQLITIPVNKLAANFNLVSYPVFCRLQDQPGQIRDWYLRLSALLGVLGIPLFVGMALVGRDAIMVGLGAKWLPAVLPFQILSLAGLPLFFNCTLRPVFNALGRPDVFTKFNAACVLTLPAGFALMGSRYGLTGVCLVWLIGFPVINVGLMVLTRRVTGIGPFDLLRSQAAALGAAAVMAAAVVATQWSTGAAQPPSRLVASIVAGALAYGGAICVAGRGTVLRDFRSLWWELKGQRSSAR